MSKYERLSALDALFLHLEGPNTPMQVGAVAIFEGGPFRDGQGRFKLEEVRAVIRSRLNFVPRFRKKIMEVPFSLGRPIWVDDPKFDIAYHVKLTALPRPGSEEQLKTLAARLQTQLLDRTKPLWEIWFVEGLENDRVAMIQRTHHCLVDGVSSVDVASAILDPSPEPVKVEYEPWIPEAPPNPVDLVRDTLLERVQQPAEIIKGVSQFLSGPTEKTVAQSAELADSFSSIMEANLVAPHSTLNAPVGRHRRIEFVRISLDDVKLARKKRGGTINDFVLAAVSGGLRHLLQSRGEKVDGVTLLAIVPVSVRESADKMKLGNRVAAMHAALPIGESDPIARLESVKKDMAYLKERKQAVAAEILVGLADYAPQTLLNLGARLGHQQRLFNVIVTNVPGPQIPLYCMGAEMIEGFPSVPLSANLGLSVAIVSYNGTLHFGLFADYDIVPDIAVLAEGIRKSFKEMA